MITQHNHFTTKSLLLSKHKNVKKFKTASKITAVATPTTSPPGYKKAKRSKVELIKEKSDFLRHPLLEELVNDKDFISEPAMQLLKFHGSYQQDHREKRAFGKGKSYQFMMRTRQPAGRVHWQLYSVMDELANEYGSGTLRLTTRQTFQLHGVLKKDLKTVFSTVIKNMGSTLAACGDVNRNVMATPAPYKRLEYEYARKYAVDIADLLAPQAGSYYDVWLDGERFFSKYFESPKVTKDREFNEFGTNFEGSPEPIYGVQFLPRKFKIAVTVPGDNSIDILTNDIAIVVMCDTFGSLLGFNILVGGGMGRAHRIDSTFPRLADPLGYVDKEDIFHAVKAIVATQRDYGRRDDRRKSRMKYLVDEWGIDRFRAVVEQYYGKKFHSFKPLPEWKYEDFLGWGKQDQNDFFYGVHVHNGRLRGQLKSTLRKIIESFQLPTIITGSQNIILCDIKPEMKEEITAMLNEGGIRDPYEVDVLERLSMACPALPLCGLAIGEAERALPDFIKRIKQVLIKVGIPETPIIIRMTGCPNGCSRPYMAELAFVGDNANSYQIWLGGNGNQTRLAHAYQDRMKINDLEMTLEPIFLYYKNERFENERFGDFCCRVGFDSIKEFSEKYNDKAYRMEIPATSVPTDVYKRLDAKAKEEGKDVTSVLNDVLNKSNL